MAQKEFYYLLCYSISIIYQELIKKQKIDDLEREKLKNNDTNTNTNTNSNTNSNTSITTTNINNIERSYLTNHILRIDQLYQLLNNKVTIESLLELNNQLKSIISFSSFIKSIANYRKKYHINLYDIQYFFKTYFYIEKIQLNYYKPSNNYLAYSGQVILSSNTNLFNFLKRIKDIIINKLD